MQALPNSYIVGSLLGLLISWRRLLGIILFLFLTITFIFHDPNTISLSYMQPPSFGANGWVSFKRFNLIFAFSQFIVPSHKMQVKPIYYYIFSFLFFSFSHHMCMISSLLPQLVSLCMWWVDNGYIYIYPLVLKLVLNWYKVKTTSCPYIFL
jgi:hypothetical protein